MVHGVKYFPILSYMYKKIILSAVYEGNTKIYLDFISIS